MVRCAKLKQAAPLLRARPMPGIAVAFIQSHGARAEDIL